MLALSVCPLRGSQLPQRGSQGGIGSGTPNHNLLSETDKHIL